MVLSTERMKRPRMWRRFVWSTIPRRLGGCPLKKHTWRAMVVRNNMHVCFWAFTCNASFFVVTCDAPGVLASHLHGMNIQLQAQTCFTSLIQSSILLLNNEAWRIIRVVHISHIVKKKKNRRCNETSHSWDVDMSIVARFTSKLFSTSTQYLDACWFQPGGDIWWMPSAVTACEPTEGTIKI